MEFAVISGGWGAGNINRWVLNGERSSGIDFNMRKMKKYFRSQFLEGEN